MDPKRILRHLSAGRATMQRFFPPRVLDAIEAEVAAQERMHGGEVRFVVETALDTVPLLRGVSARERAIEVFSEERVWDTEANNGVLIYLLLADHDVEIVADRGICRHVSNQEWSEVCHAMEIAFAGGEFLAGSIEGVRAVSRLIARHFPPSCQDSNELPNRPLVR